MSLLQTPFEIKDPGYTEIRYTPGGDIAKGAVTVITGSVLVAIADVLTGEEGAFAVRSTKATVKKAAPLVLAAGDLVYWDIADGEVNADSAGPNVFCGWVASAAASADVEVDIVFDGLN